MVHSSLRDFTDHPGDLDTTVGCCLLQHKIIISWKILPHAIFTLVKAMLNPTSKLAFGNHNNQISLYGNSTVSGTRQRCLMRMNPHWMRSWHFLHFHETLWCELWWQYDLIYLIASAEHPVYGHSEWAMRSSCVVYSLCNQLLNSGGNLHRMECDR